MAICSKLLHKWKDEKLGQRCSQSDLTQPAGWYCVTGGEKKTNNTTFCGHHHSPVKYGYPKCNSVILKDAENI
jgi:hypothetical protein